MRQIQSDNNNYHQFRHSAHQEIMHSGLYVKRIGKNIESKIVR